MYRECWPTVRNRGNNIDNYKVGNSSSDEDPFNTDSDYETSTTESGTSTSDEGDNETSEREDNDIIDLCSGSDNDCTMNRSVMPEDFVTIPETFTMMPSSLELPEPDNFIQE